MQGKRAIILASGASILDGVSQGLFSYLAKEVVFSINDNIQFVNSTVAMFGDWTCYRDRFNLFRKHPLVIGRYDTHFTHKIEGALPCPKHEGLILLQGSGKYYGEDGLSKGLYSAVLSGAFTLNLVIRLGYKEIFLLGFDNREINGLTHWYQNVEGAGQFTNYCGILSTGVGKDEAGNYRTSFYNQEDCQLNLLWEPFSQETDISIINVSPESRITVFQKIDYGELLSHLENNPIDINQDVVRQEIRNQLQPYNKVSNDNSRI